ncbi:uncharacterized protein LOC119453846 isoform X7 [Dermacentor silvarum]|uniref:uncharacterized protein LOC119453846 isoform X7 n=1 Tax=Dermacentor silvarum TaxID=543639 RepID=UPI002101B8F0|nr:uncharacterized protein LOC119453846 isoform X7 [Dermacentor silvarum]
MPPRRRTSVDAEERKRKRAEAARARRASESVDAREARLAKARASHAKKTGEAREARLAQMRAYRARQERRGVEQRLDALERNRVAQHRRVAAETSEKYNERLLRCRAAKQIRWASMSEEEREAELALRRELQRTRHRLMPARERAQLLDRMRAAARARRAAATSNLDPAAPRTARCVVPVCHSRSAPSSILYPLPAEPSQRQAWIDFVRGCPCGGACDWNPPSNEISLVCSLHFSVRCFRFQRPRGYSVGYSKRLRRDAVPTLYPIEEQCSSVPNESFPDDTAERLASSGVEDAEGRARNSLASSRSVPGQDRGHCASDQDTARRLAHLAAFELTFLKNVSTQCSVEMASKAASCAVRTVSKSVQCSG